MLQLIKFAYQFIRPHKQGFRKLIILAVISTSLLSLRPLSLKFVIDALSLKQTEVIVLPLVGFVLLQVLANLFLAWFSKQDYTVFYKNFLNYYKFIINYISGHDHKFFTKHSAGAITSDVIALDKASFFLNNLIRDVIKILLHIVITVGVLIGLNPILGTFATVWTIVSGIVLYFAFRKLQHKSEVYEAERSQLDSKIFDFINNISVLRIFNKLKAHQKVFDRRIQTYQKKAQEVWTLRGLIEGGAKLTHNLMAVLFLYFAIPMYFAGSITIGDMLVYEAILGYLDYLVWVMVNFFIEYDRSFAPLKTAQKQTLVTREDLFDADFQNPTSLASVNIQIQKLAFSYGSQCVFKNFDLEIQKGEKIGLIGLSGSGKSTLIQILTGVLHIDKNQVFIDDQDIAPLDNQTLRSYFSEVPQDTSLFNRTLRENIDLSGAKSDKQIILALKQAQLYKFYKTLSKGLDTMVGERGVKLSGGQRQRVAIARAMLVDAPVIILDEATSALDSHSETKVQKAIASLVKDKTLIAVAHRLSTLKEMERIVVLHKGKIVASGTHNQLLNYDNLYKEFWDHQKGGYI